MTEMDQGPEVIPTPATAPDRNLALDLVRVTEAAAMGAGRWVGRGDKIAADQAAVDAMRLMLHTVSMDGVVVIGEGEKDEAPMLYNGEPVGNGQPPEVDVAVDPLEGTRLTALGLAGLGDTLVTSLGGRNRLYGELIGEGVEPDRALDDLNRRGMTGEGVDSAKDIRRLMAEQNLNLRLHDQVFRVLFESAPAMSLLECIAPDLERTDQ